MTLSTTTSKVSYAGDGSTTAFAVPFLYLANGDITAVLRDAAGAETIWVESTQYTLTGAGNPSGGTLTVKTTPTDYTPASGETLVIHRVMAETQGTDYPEGGAFPASAHEQALDRLTMLVQAHSEELTRSLHYPVSDATSISAEIANSANRAGKVLAFDGSGAPVVSTTTLAAIETGATDAAASAAAAATSATNAATSASNAATSASNAATSATNAANSATNAATSETNAAASAATAAAALTRSWIIAASDETTVITTGTGKATFRAPEAIATLSEVRASVNTVSSSGVITVDINKNGTTMLSTKLTIDANEKSSKTAASAAVISVSTIADDDEITIDIDTAGTGAKGLKVTLIGDV